MSWRYNTVDGKYKLSLSTPMGEQSGMLSIITSKDAFTGTVKMQTLLQIYSFSYY